MTSGGDFLSGFSGGSTKKPLTEPSVKPVKDEKPIETENNHSNEIKKAENKKLADKIVEESEKKPAPVVKPLGTSPSTPVPTRPAQSANSVIKAPEHIVTRDEKFHKRTLIKYGVIGIILIAVALIIFLIFRMVNNVEVPNFVGDELQRAERWDIQGGATIAINHEYSIEFNEGIISAQSVEPGETISRSSVLTITVSRGPDMNEVIELPDFYEMTQAQIRTWSDTNRLRGIQFRTETSTEVDQNHVIRVTFPPTVDPDNFRRSYNVTIYVSSGPSTVQITNFIGRDLDDVREFIEDNPWIELVIEHEAHDTIEPGTVMRQDPTSGARLAEGDTLTVVISAGDPIVVPDWANIRRINAEIDFPEGLDVTIVDRFNGTIPLGRFMSQSVEAGTEVFIGHEIEVIYSLGRPWIPDLVGGLENEIVPLINDFNDQGAYITERVTYVDSWKPRGQILTQNLYHQFVELNAHLAFTVSRGNLVEPEEPEDDPITAVVADFSRISRADAEEIAPAGLYRILDRYHVSLGLGQFVSQSVRAGRVVETEDNEIQVTYSLGRPWIDSLIGRYENAIDPWINDFNARGANLSRTINQVNHWAPRGTIVSQSTYNTFVGLNTRITFGISRGNLLEPEDLDERWILHCDALSIPAPGEDPNNHFRLSIIRNWHELTQLPSGLTIRTERPSWISWSANSWQNLTINRSNVTVTTPISITLRLMRGTEELDTCLIPINAPVFVPPPPGGGNGDDDYYDDDNG